MNLLILLLFLIVIVGFVVLMELLFAPRKTKESIRQSIADDHRKNLLRSYIS